MTHATRASIALAAFVLLSSLTTTASTSGDVPQQGIFPPTRLVNLQVFPKDAPPAAIIDVMKQLTQALGVRCDHCHVGIDGQPLTTFDFASDDKKAKNTARTMMRIVEQINAALDKTVPGQDGGRVTCVTCHNGRRTPRK